MSECIKCERSVLRIHLKDGKCADCRKQETRSRSKRAFTRLD